MRLKMRATAFMLAMAIPFTLAGCSGSAKPTSAQGDSANNGKPVTLTYLIWDKNQTPGMQAMCDAYTAQHPNVTIQVQTSTWDEYWTKLEAAATGNALPDIFWMHTNEIFQYADNGMLADVTNLYGDPNYYKDHFSDISIENASGSDGKMYGVPKDKDTIGLVYNKEMFDAAGVSYPDETWTWNNLIDASQKIYDATGKYGFMAACDDQAGYWNFVYQAGGYILNDDKTKAGFTDPATKKAMEFYVGIQKYDWCPDQNYFAETIPADAFFSQKGAMFIDGVWDMKSYLDTYPDMVGKWDVAVLPKCPDPAKGDGRASISNGLCFSVGAKGKNKDVALDVIKFFGTEDAMKIQGESGAAIPAYIGTEDTFKQAFQNYSYKIDIGKFFDEFDYGVQSVNNPSRPEWKQPVQDALMKAYSGEITLDDALQQMQKIVDDASAK